ncbi:MAG TPA: type II secretion system F family protein [Solirubrobacter sp.]|nr:type II secretion system F family protein [Solirubrobacter sp.]
MLAVALAFGAAAAAVAGAWELLGAVERTHLAGLLARSIAPVVRAGREGASPTAAERRRLAVLAAAALAAAGWLAGGVPAAVLAGVAGPAVATSVVRGRRRRFRAALAGAAPVVARALADALAGGHSVRGALAVVASGTRGAPGHELRAAARALALGAGTEEVLERLRRRAGSPAWDALVAGVLLQRDAGGDLPGLLRDLAAALEAAARQDRDALAATAQARFTARTVLLLPVGAALLAELARPGLIASLAGNPVSAWLTGLALALQLLALACVHRLTRRALR